MFDKHEIHMILVACLLYGDESECDMAARVLRRMGLRSIDAKELTNWAFADGRAIAMGGGILSFAHAYIHHGQELASHGMPGIIRRGNIFGLFGVADPDLVN